MAEFGSVQTAAQSVISGNDPRLGRGPFVNQLILCDTLGAASARQDGWLLVLDATAAGLCNCDCIEVDELCYPVRIAERSLVTDSEGAGRFRGAPSSRVEIAPVGCSMRAVYLSDGTVYPSQGVRGGLPGAPARNFKRTKSGEHIPADGWGDLELEAGESVNRRIPRWRWLRPAHRTRSAAREARRRRRLCFATARHRRLRRRVLRGGRHRCRRHEAQTPHARCRDNRSRARTPKGGRSHGNVAGPSAIDRQLHGCSFKAAARHDMSE